MARFIEGKDRRQTLLLPECLDDYVTQDNPVRVIDAFIDELDLQALGFTRAQPATTGRPAYHPAILLKIYLYGYLHRVPSSRRLEREAGRNLELIWLTGQLVPDFKTIADFRRDNAAAIRATCRQFVALCRDLGLLAGREVAVDGSKFKAVNNPDRNFTHAKLARQMAKVEASIAHYLEALDQIDQVEDESTPTRVDRLHEKIAVLRQRMQGLQAIGEQLEASPDQQVSLTDPDARAMPTRTDLRGVVGYNVQAALDTQNHLIVAHEVTNRGSDRHHLATMANQAKTAMGAEALTVLADRGYYAGEKILECERTGITALVPKPLTSPAKAEGRFGKQDFVYEADDDTYRCPAGEKLTRRFASVEKGMTIHVYWTTRCAGCALKAQCTTGRERRIRRWKHEAVLDAMEERLRARPDAMQVRKSTVEHAFGTLKGWMGATHFLTKGLKTTAAEMALHVLAYNMKRVIGILGVQPLLAGIRV
jgi:transposase